MNLTIKKLSATLALSALLTITAATAAEASTKTVEKGDTLSKIALMNNVSLETIIESNPQIENINLIYIGDKINLEGTQQLSAAKQVTPVKPTTTASTSHSESDLQLLAGLIQTEAGGESYAGKVAVGQVVMNRVKSDLFPNSVAGVIYQQNQFAAPKTPSAEAIKAAREAMNSAGNDMLFFYNPATATVNLAAYHTVVKTIGNHVFLK